ncbi:MAG: hypothetical protein GXP13_06195 [Gammaproteobacteria bacterium]|nr:hypothetical protein [Gammaproteobacteria bacterium]
MDLHFYSRLYQSWFVVSVLLLVLSSLTEPAAYTDVAGSVVTVSIGLLMYRILKHVFFKVRSGLVWVESLVSFLPGIIAMSIISGYRY